MQAINLALAILASSVVSSSVCAQNPADKFIAEMNRIYAQPDADRLVEAQQRAISREATLGPDHIETLHAQASVVSLLRRLCRDEEAAALERRVNPKLLPIRAEGMLRQAKVIEDRGGTPTSELTEAGDAYVKLGKLSDARQVYDRAIAGLQKDYHEKGVKTPLGESHHYSMPRAGIAEVDWLEGRLVEAEQGYGEAMGAWGSEDNAPLAWLDSLEKIYRARQLAPEADAIKLKVERRRAQLEKTRGCRKH